MNIQQPIKI